MRLWPFMLIPTVVMTALALERSAAGASFWAVALPVIAAGAAAVAVLLGLLRWWLDCR